MDTRQFIEASIERLNFKVEECNQQLQELNGSNDSKDLAYTTFLTGQRSAYEAMIRDLKHDLAMYNLLDIGTDPDAFEEELQSSYDEQNNQKYRVRYESGVIQEYPSNHIADVLEWTKQSLSYGAGDTYIDVWNDVTLQYELMCLSRFHGYVTEDYDEILVSYGDFGFHAKWDFEV